MNQQEMNESYMLKGFVFKNLFCWDFFPGNANIVQKWTGRDLNR